MIKQNKINFNLSSFNTRGSKPHKIDLFQRIKKKQNINLRKKKKKFHINSLNFAEKKLENRRNRKSENKMCNSEKKQERKSLNQFFVKERPKAFNPDCLYFTHVNDLKDQGGYTLTNMVNFQGKI